VADRLGEDIVVSAAVARHRAADWRSLGRFPLKGFDASEAVYAPRRGGKGGGKGIAKRGEKKR